jgi:hypothetical protein
VSARVLRGTPALLGGLLLASPARAQAPDASPPAPQAAPQVAPQGTVIVVQAPPPPGYYPPPTYYYPPPGYSPYPYPYPPAQQPPPPSDRGFSAKLYAGPSYQTVFGLSIPGAEIGAFMGGVRGISGWYGGFDAFFGQMSYGLFTMAVRPGATWEARLGRVHLGLGFNFIVVGVQRATTGSFMTSGGLGGSVFATVDLVQGEQNALFLGAKLHADVIEGSDAGGSAPIFWGPSAAVGWRYY